MDKYDIFEGLNSSQKEAVQTISGPMLVLAGAGTGKTKVITHRIANLIENWIAPESIIGLTFTNKAAREMKERIELILGDEKAYKIFLGTFHSFCMRVLRAEVEKTHLHKNFTIADEQDQKGTLKLAIAELKLKESEIDINLFISFIGKAKQDLKLPDQCKITKQSHIGTIELLIYEKYQEILTAQNMLDFDDILMYTVNLWEKYPDILEKYQEKYKYVLIDEFQDTNYAQFKLIKLLSSKYKNLCVVGDDDQSIYAWRGAIVDNILNFPTLYQNCKVVKLEQNYRSTNTILDVANVFISGNKQRHSKKLWSENGVGEKVKVSTLKTDRDEAFYVADQILKLQRVYPDIKLSDIAILYRSNHQSRLFEEQLRLNRIPYKLIGSSFYDRKEVRDAVAYLKLLVNPYDDQSLLRILGVPPRSLGLKFLDNARAFNKKNALLKTFEEEEFFNTLTPKQKSTLSDFTSCIKIYTSLFAQNGNLSKKARTYFAQIGYLNCFQRIYKNIDEAEERQENVIELINAMGHFEGCSSTEDATLINFLESFTLSDDSDKVEGQEEKNAVTLLTVHSAKGLEFPCVFIVGMEQNLFPHSRALKELDTDEERRLFYVAITRAKIVLYMTNAAIRMKYGSHEYQLPSEFLSELPESLIENLSKRKLPIKKASINNAFKSFYAQFGKTGDKS